MVSYFDRKSTLYLILDFLCCNAWIKLLKFNFYNKLTAKKDRLEIIRIFDWFSFVFIRVHRLHPNEMELAKRRIFKKSWIVCTPLWGSTRRPKMNLEKSRNAHIVFDNHFVLKWPQKFSYFVHLWTTLENVNIFKNIHCTV